jgi:sRNA-binding carbon storage regulator CsrA
MGLNLTVKKGDWIEIGDVTAYISRTTHKGEVQINFEGPRSVKINRIQGDESQLDKTLRERANSLSPEKQRESALTVYKNRGNRK